MRSWILTVSALLLLGPALGANAAVKMAVIPFEAEVEEVRYLRDGVMDMLFSRIAQQEGLELVEPDRLAKEVIDLIREELNRGEIPRAAEELGLDFLLFGSLKRIGEQIQLDARLLDIKAAGKSLRFFVETESLEGLLPKVGEMARSIGLEATRGVVPAGVAEVPRVVRRVVVEGVRRLSPEAVLKDVGTREGSTFSRSILEEDLKSIHRLELVADVQGVIRYVDDGVEITFRIEEKAEPPRPVVVAKVNFVGNQRLPSQALLSAIRSRPGSPFLEKQVQEDLEALRRFPGVEAANLDLMETEEGKELFFIIKEKVAEVPTVIPPEERVRRIDIEGSVVVDAAAIRALLKTKVGEPFSKELVREDLKAVFKTGYFDDVRVELVETKTGKELTFVVVEKPSVAEITVRGNKKVSDGDILQALGYKAREVYSPAKVKGSLEKVRQLYAEKGFYAAQVDYRLDELPTRQVRVTYTIVEGKKIFIRKIGFRGNRAFSSKELEKAVTTKEKDLFSWFTGSGILNHERLEADRQLLMAFYGDHGYVKATAGQPEVKIDEKGIYVTYPVEEGDRYNVGQVSLTGELIVEPEEMRKKLKLVPGQTFSRENLRKDLEFITDYYSDRGFAFANVTPSYNFDDAQKKLDVVYAIEKSRKVFIERIDIAGNVVTRDKVIRRQLTFAEGDLFSGSELTSSKRRVNNLGYFSKVELTSGEGTAKDRLKMNVGVTEAPTGSFSVGAGVSSQEGPSVFGEVRQNNFLGRGWQTSLRAQLGGVTTLFELSFIDPAFLDSRFSFATDLFNTIQDFRDFDREATGGVFRFSYPILSNWRLGAGYRAESVQLADLGAAASALLQAETGRSFVSAINWDVLRDTTDSPLDPTTGSIGRFFSEVGGGPLGGDADFVRNILDLRRFFPFSLLKRTAVVMVRGQGGVVNAFAGNRVRVFERFFLGGIDSIRGYEPRSVGPRDKVTGEVVGGTKELFFNTELIYPLWDKFNVKGVVFFDAGNAYGPGEGFNPSDLRKSFGLGVRFQSPLGPIRVEYGIALDRLKGDDMGRLEFRFGR